MSSYVKDEFDYHKSCFKSVGVDLDDILSDSFGILPIFKEKLMPLIKVLRSKIELYDKFKCRAIDVAFMLLDVFECCVEISKKNDVIYGYIKSKLLTCEKV